MQDTNGYDTSGSFEPAQQKGYISLALNAHGLRCLVVGGGVVGTRKVRTLLEGGACVTVVAPEVSPELTTLAERGTIHWKQGCYTKGGLEMFSLVVAATDDRHANQEIGDEARRKNIFCCVASPGAGSQVIFPAVLRTHGLTVAVHSNGMDCRKSVSLRDTIARMLHKDT